MLYRKVRSLDSPAKIPRDVSMNNDIAKWKIVNKHYAHKFKVGSSTEMNFQKFGTKLPSY